MLPVSDPFSDYATQVSETLRTANIRAEVDTQDAKLGYKIREAEVQKIPYMLIVGKQEVEKATVSVRRHGEGDLGALSLEALTAKMRQEIEEKSS